MVSVVVAETILFRRSLTLFQRFEIETRIVGWDERAFLLEQRFLRPMPDEAGKVRRGQDSDDPRRGAGSARIDAAQDRVRVGTANEKGEGCVLYPDVVEISARAGHKADILFAPDGLADTELHAFYS